jgi:hypothetical protein
LNGLRRTPTRSRRIDDLEQEATAVLAAAAVRVGALVAARVQELREQVAVGGVQLDAIGAAGNGALRRIDERLAGAGEVAGIHRFRHRVRLHAFGVGPDRAGRGDRRRRDELRAGRQVRRVADAADVHQLHEQVRAFAVHGVGDLPPAGTLFGAEQAGDAGVAEAVRTRRGAFADHEAGAGALAVVLRHQRIGHVGQRARTGHRRHRDAVLQGQAGAGQGLGQRVHREVSGWDAVTMGPFCFRNKHHMRTRIVARALAIQRQSGLTDAALGFGTSTPVGVSRCCRSAPFSSR